MKRRCLNLAFSIYQKLERSVYRFRLTKTVLVPLSYPVYTCQVDRGGLERTRVRFILILGLMLGLNVSLSAELLPRAPLGLVWEAEIGEGALYYAEVEALLANYERKMGVSLSPQERGKVGIKVNTRGGRGLSTPNQLLRALIEAFEFRGYSREHIILVDYSGHQMRQAGIMPSLSDTTAVFDGCPVVALDSGKFYDTDWFYDSPLPPALQQEPKLFGSFGGKQALEEGDEARKSFLPQPLLFDVDFWVNCAVGVDDPALGIDGALASATLWNVSNSQRFLVNQATASAAVAEIAAIPELEERMILHFVSLERYQFIAGPFFNSLYSRSESKLWMSSDPVAVDRLLLDRFNAWRLLEGFPEIHPMPRQLPFAASLGLGVHEKSKIQITPVHTVAGPSQTKPQIITPEVKNTLN